MDVIFIIVIFIIGACIGSFLSAALYRAHVGKTLVYARSECPVCQKQIAWYDNIPIVSFIILGGHCRSCSAKISWQYPALEITLGWLFVFVWQWYGDLFSLGAIIRDVSIISILLFLFVYDARHKEIWDSTTIIPAGILFVLQAFFPNLFFPALIPSVSGMLIGVATGGGFFLLQYVVSRGRWIGGGDIRMGVFMGVILGWQVTLAALFLSYILGAVVGVYLLATKRKELGSEIPFGTFLALSTVVMMFYGSGIVYWYVNLLGF